MVNDNVEIKDDSEVGVLKDVIKDWLNEGFENEVNK